MPFHLYITLKIRNQAYLDKFGNNLKKLLKDKKKSPEDVAAIGQIETKQVYRVINAEHSCSLSTIIALAKGLGVHPKELFDFEFDLED